MLRIMRERDDAFRLFACGFFGPGARLHAGFRPMEKLAAVGFGFFNDRRDLSVIVVEGFAEQKNGALQRRQFLEHMEKSEPERICEKGDVVRCARVIGSNEWFGQPNAHVVFSSMPRGAQLVDAEPRDGRDQPRFGRGNAGGILLVPANEGFLHHVLCVGDRPQHSVSNAEEE